jgi:hypothetical protein
MPPKYGRAFASTAGSDDYVPLDEMMHATGRLADGAVDRVSAFARRVGDDLADRLRAELDARARRRRRASVSPRSVRLEYSDS